MATKPKDPLRPLIRCIEQYAEASRADEMKGGGDPDAIPIIEAELELSRARLNAQLAFVRREFETE